MSLLLRWIVVVVVYYEHCLVCIYSGSAFTSSIFHLIHFHFHFSTFVWLINFWIVVYSYFSSLNNALTFLFFVYRCFVMIKLFFFITFNWKVKTKYNSLIKTFTISLTISVFGVGFSFNFNFDLNSTNNGLAHSRIQLDRIICANTNSVSVSPHNKQIHIAVSYLHRILSSIICTQKKKYS